MPYECTYLNGGLRLLSSIVNYSTEDSGQVISNVVEAIVDLTPIFVADIIQDYHSPLISSATDLTFDFYHNGGSPSRWLGDAG